ARPAPRFPTAHTSVGDVACTSASAPGVVVVTDHDVPFQCSIMPPELPLLPTAHTSFVAVAETFVSREFPDPPVGSTTGDTVHAVPFQCSARTASVPAPVCVDPTVQTSVGEMAAMPVREVVSPAA